MYQPSDENLVVIYRDWTLGGKVSRRQYWENSVSLYTTISSFNILCHEITEILLKVALNIISLNNPQNSILWKLKKVINLIEIYTCMNFILDTSFQIWPNLIGKTKQWQYVPKVYINFFSRKKYACNIIRYKSI